MSTYQELYSLMNVREDLTKIFPDIVDVKMVFDGTELYDNRAIANGLKVNPNFPKFDGKYFSIFIDNCKLVLKCPNQHLDNLEKLLEKRGYKWVKE